MLKEKLPLVSVIIPMYNSAKFIPQTLESLLYQTMKNFEVIVIDDCSTDDSVRVVESFKERFGGRLRILKMPKNTGRPGIPRNVGIRAACGKYIAFLDSDDLFTKTALEELTTLAEEYQADIVHINNTYAAFKGKALRVEDPRFGNVEEIINPENLEPAKWKYTTHWFAPEPLPAPVLESDDLEVRIKNWVKFEYRMPTWTNFCNRKFLMNNNISFPDMVANEDQIFLFKCLCLAKNFLSVPNVIYIMRARIGSIMRTAHSHNSKEYLQKWLTIINSGINELNKIVNQIPFFQQHAEYKTAVFEFFFRFNVHINQNLSYDQNRTGEVYPIIKQFFNADNAPLAAYLLADVKNSWSRLKELDTENKRLKERKDIEQ